MLDYGAKAQEKFDRKTDAPANENLKQSDRETPYSMDNNVTADDINSFITANSSAARSDMTKNLDEYGLSYIGSSVVYLTKHTLRHYYVVKDSTKFDKVKDTITFGGVKCEPQKKQNDSDNVIYFEYSDVAAQNMGKRIAFHIGSNEYNYSVLDYSAVVLELSENGSGAVTENDVALAKAAYIYADSAASYVK